MNKQEIMEMEQQVFQQFERVLKAALPIGADYLPQEKKKNWANSFKQDSTALTSALTDVKKALAHLPQQYEKISYFAYRLFHDPHRLDRGTLRGRLFFDCLEVFAQRFNQNTDFLGDAEWENLVYEFFYLLKDDSYNAVQINGLTAENSGGEIRMWREAACGEIAWNVPLKHILEVERILPFQGDKVLFVENSGVFSIVCGAYPKLPIVCSSGQFRYSVWKIAEKLIDGGTQIYYSGDLDPAGLHMAQKMLRRFGEKVSLLLMDEAAYRQVPKSVALSKEHLRQLGSINAPQLTELRDLMKTEELAGYQEGMIEALFQILAQW